jgi:hypothetical protein
MQTSHLRGLHFLGLVVNFVSFHERIALEHTFEAADSPEIVGELRYGIGRQLM